MEETMKKIEIEDFIKIIILELNEEEIVCFVDSYNEKYFYRDDNNRIYAHQSTYIFYYQLYFQKASIIYRSSLDELEKDVYELYRKLTFKIPRAKKNITYYFIDSNFEVKEVEEENVYFDNTLYATFNYFTSKEEAEKYAKKLQAYLIELWKEELKNEN